MKTNAVLRRAGDSSAGIAAPRKGFFSIMKHILILFTDQQRYDTVSAFGNPAIQTPNLDALARDSLVYNRCITPSPVCVPARLSLMAGQYPARTGCNNNNADRVYQGEGFYSRLTAAGYTSCCVGKMHNLWDPYGAMGFTQRRSQEELAAPGDEYAAFIRKKYPWVFDVHGMRSEMYYMPQISPLAPADHPSAWIGDRSVEFIENYSSDKPMFLFSSFIHPHPPYCPPAPWQKLYREDPPAPFVPEEEALPAFSELIGSRCSLERLQMSRQDILRSKNFYYACVSYVDYQVGRIIQALKDKGMYEDTLILFTSDHGDMMGDFNAIGKRTMVDSSCHVPFILHVPGRGHEEISAPCSLVDVAPTLLRYAGVETAAGEFDGIDLLGGEEREYVFSQHGCGDAGTYMVTDGKNKLIYRAAGDRYYFFDTCPEERECYDAENPVCQKLRLLLDNYRRSDCNHSASSMTYEPVSRTHPHYPGRIDHRLFHDAEKAAIPEGYQIDL